MPRVSERRKLLHDFRDQIAVDSMPDIIFDSSSSSSSFSESSDNELSALDLRALLDESRFNQETPMSKESFHHIVGLIGHDPIFVDPIKQKLSKQESTELQFLTAFSRLGCGGNGASVGQSLHNLLLNDFFDPVDYTCDDQHIGLNIDSESIQGRTEGKQKREFVKELVFKALEIVD